MNAATQLAKLRMEKRLAFLGTLGSNAPFIGLLGTVIGIIRAFPECETLLHAQLRELCRRVHALLGGGGAVRDPPVAAEVGMSERASAMARGARLVAASSPSRRRPAAIGFPPQRSVARPADPILELSGRYRPSTVDGAARARSLRVGLAALS